MGMRGLGADLSGGLAALRGAAKRWRRRRRPEAASTQPLFGRAALEGHLLRLTQRLAPETSVACCAFGLEGMREFSRVYGFDAGDALAAAAFERLAAALPEDAPLFRATGARFITAIVGDDGPAVRSRAHAIVAEFAVARFDLGFGPVAVELSAGASTARAAALGGSAVFETAMAALDAARSDVEPVCVIDAGAPAREVAAAAAMRSGARRIIRALEGDGLAIAFQPIVAAAPPHSVAFRECLARVREPDGGWWPATEFMRRIERLDLVAALDRRILRLALETLREQPYERLSINVSARTLRDRGWLRLLREGAEEDSRSVERLIVELTEGAAVDDPDRAARFLDQARNLGCAVALDDFGAGYSSFRHLRDFRPDWVKIDGAFTRGIASDPDNMLYVDTLVGIAGNFEMATVAEHVESDGDAETLLALGVDCLQGFRFGEPQVVPDWSAGAVRIAGE